MTPDVTPTGFTRHVVRGVPFGPATGLAIARYVGSDGYYLFYLGPDGRVATDTWHESVQRAFSQAALEYEGLRWSAVVPP